MDADLAQPVDGEVQVVGLKHDSFHSATLIFEDDRQRRHDQPVCIDLVPTDYLTGQILHILALITPEDVFFELHRNFLELWSSRGFLTSDGIEFECITSALCCTFELRRFADVPLDGDLWSSLVKSSSHDRFREDPALRALSRPNTPLHTLASEVEAPLQSPQRKTLLAPILYALHTLGEDLRLSIDHYKALTKLAPVICMVALVIRPEWADYWKRLCPDAMTGWPQPTTSGSYMFHRSMFILTFPFRPSGRRSTSGMAPRCFCDSVRQGQQP
jgi:anaphase-promoting complex subunit 1